MVAKTWRFVTEEADLSVDSTLLADKTGEKSVEARCNLQNYMFSSRHATIGFIRRYTMLLLVTLIKSSNTPSLPILSFPIPHSAHCKHDSSPPALQNSDSHHYDSPQAESSYTCYHRTPPQHYSSHGTPTTSVSHRGSGKTHYAPSRSSRLRW